MLFIGIVKHILEAKGIKYTENNDEQQMLSMNFTVVPVLDVDGKQMKFAEAVKWINEQ
jgi:hypothetical protein